MLDSIEINNETLEIAKRLLGGAALETFDQGQAGILLEHRNRNIGSMFSSESVLDYILILYRLLLFRREHELEVLHDFLFEAVQSGIQASKTDIQFTKERFEQEMLQLENWQLIEKRLEKSRLRSYKDARKVRFRYRLSEEAVAFLSFLENRLQSDLIPHDDDSINLLEFVLGTLKQINRDLLHQPEGHNCVFSLFDVQDKTAKLSRNLSGITANLGNFLLRSYSAEDAKNIVNELGKYFDAYLRHLAMLRLKILDELERICSNDKQEPLRKNFEDYWSEQKKLPGFMRSNLPDEVPEQQIAKLINYYKRNGLVDKLCSTVHDNAMRVLGKLTAFLRELERRSNRLEFLNMRVQELASQDKDFEASAWLWDLLRPAAAPLDPNDSYEGHKAEPPTPRASSDKKRRPPRSFKRTKPLKEKHTETIEEMRMRLLSEFIRQKYPNNGVLSSVQLSGIEDFKQIAFLLKRGILSEGSALKELKKSLRIEPAQTMKIGGEGGDITGLATIIEGVQ